MALPSQKNLTANTPASMISSWVFIVANGACTMEFSTDGTNWYPAVMTDGVTPSSGGPGLFTCMAPWGAAIRASANCEMHPGTAPVNGRTP